MLDAEADGVTDAAKAKGTKAKVGGKRMDTKPGGGSPKRSSLIKTSRNAELDAKGDILTPFTHGSGVGKVAKEDDEPTIPTTSQSHDPSVKAWPAGIDSDDLMVFITMSSTVGLGSLRLMSS